MMLKNSLTLLAVFIIIKCEQEMAFGFNENQIDWKEAIAGENNTFTCGERWSCEANENVSVVPLSNHFREMNCFCDDDCAYFQDCCPDAMASKRETEHSIKIPKELIACVKIEEVSNINTFYVVNRCPDAWLGPGVKTKCEMLAGEDLLLKLIVTGVNTGLTYRNMYCAMCHEEEYVYWAPSVSCDYRYPVYDSILPNASILETLAYPGCSLQFSQPNDSIRYRQCLPDIIDKCDPQFNNTFISQLCETSESMKLVRTKDKTFRNPSCATCNFKSQNMSCFTSFSLKGPKRWGFYSFSILFDMNTRTVSSTVGTVLQKVSRNITEIHTCADTEVYDPFSLKCRGVVCDAPFVYLDGLCRSNRSAAEAGNLTECPRVKLDQREYTVLSDDILLEISTGRRYARSEYTINGSSAFVCANLTQNYTDTKVVETFVKVLTFSLSEAIVSVVGLTISLAALLVTILTYACITSLQNIPGKSLLSLSCSLFVAELLMLVAPSADRVFVLCKGIAIFMHYFFLVAFFWMNVMAADVWFTFSKSFVKAGTKSSKRFYFYSLYSWGVPFLILVTSLLVDSLLTDSNFKPNYGTGLCWFANKNALMVFFAMPLFLIILMNMTFFAIASKNIYEARRSSARHLHTSENSSPFLYMKLFFVVGLTWIVGFLASLVARSVLWYLFAILNTLQGFFIFLSFVATTKVIRLIRARLLTFRTGQQTESNQPSSPTRSTSVAFKIGSNITL